MQSASRLTKGEVHEWTQSVGAAIYKNHPQRHKDHIKKLLLQLKVPQSSKSHEGLASSISSRLEQELQKNKEFLGEHVKSEDVEILIFQWHIPDQSANTAGSHYCAALAFDKISRGLPSAIVEGERSDSKDAAMKSLLKRLS